MSRSLWIRHACLTVLVMTLGAGVASAIPTFARRYATSCATCHQAWPRLNGVGESFRISGYRFVDDDRYRKQQPVELGDEAYERLWPKALWPSHIPSSAPLSFVSRFMAEVDIDGTRADTVTYLLPEEIELVWAGNIGEDLIFYGDVIFLQKDFGGLDIDSWATLKAWLQFEDLFGIENSLNLRVGSVGTQSMGLFTARDANTYGTHFYLYTSWFMPKPRLAAADLTEFKGNNFSIAPQTGLEINGFGTRWFYALGMASGDLDTPNGQPPPSDVSFMGSGTHAGDLYGQFVYKIGGIPFDRGGEQAAESLTTGAEFWRDDSFTVSLFGYLGTATIRSVDLEGTTREGEDDFWRFGVGLQKQYRDISVSAAYVMGDDDQPYAGLSDAGVESRTWHVEVLGFPYPWLIPYLRYEALELDMPADVPGLSPEQDIARVMAGAKFMIRPNVFCTVEGAYYTEGEELEEGFDQTLFILLGVSF